MITNVRYPQRTPALTAACKRLATIAYAATGGDNWLTPMIPLPMHNDILLVVSTLADYEAQLEQQQSEPPLAAVAPEKLCKRGHLMTPESRYQSPSGRVECRQCRRERSRNRRAPRA